MHHFLVYLKWRLRQQVEASLSHTPSAPCSQLPKLVQQLCSCLFLTRAHISALLRRSASGEAPLGLLKDRWDGAVETEKSFHVAKRARGEFAGVLPGKTRKWKELYGMHFRWVLEEALGAGLVEMFETGSVGPGIRCL